jgi:Bacterial archaeo-eukaryotic release factor family 10
MREVDRRRLEQLCAWRPQHGVISAFFEIDRGDRSAGWRVEVKDGLAELPEPGDHEGKLAVRETATRLRERFDGDSEPPPGRAQAGFIEVSREPGREDWAGLQVGARIRVVRHAPRPLLVPLIDLLDRGRPRPVLAVSSERVRGWVWDQGRLEPQPGWEAELAIYAGHERKAPAMADPARGQATSSSGRDQFGQRLEENRKRFLRDFAQQIREDTRLNGNELVAIGEAHYLEEFASGLPAGLRLHRIDGPDVIAEKDRAVAERVESELERVQAAAVLELARDAVDAAMASEGRGATGADEISEALAEGRVEHLLLDPDHELELDDLSPLARDGVAGAEALGAAELMVELALGTSAKVTLMEGAAAEMLREHGGAAALLRY